MKRTGTGRPTLSWCLIVRNAAKTLETTLKAIRALTPDAEICIVDTMSNDYPPEAELLDCEGVWEGGTAGGMYPTAVCVKCSQRANEHRSAPFLKSTVRVPRTVEIAQRYVDKWIEWTGPRGKWSREMVAFDDAAAARNKSFELASGKWIGWIDADDELVPPQEANRLLTVNGYLISGAQTDLPAQSEVDVGDKKQSAVSFEQYLESVWADGKIEVFYAPYLYRFKSGPEGEAGAAAEWQIRERIVRADAEGRLAWSWKRPAHEILCPDDPAQASKMILLSTLLFVHRKEWNDDDIRYAIDRHWAIVKAAYDLGERDFFDLHYLCSYGAVKAPELRDEFTRAYLDAASTPGERARSWAARGAYLYAEGFFLETIEAYLAGTACDPTLPDNYFGLAETYGRADRWAESAQWYERGCSVSYAHPFSLVSPRQHTIVNRVLGGLAFWRAWKAGQLGPDALDRAVALAQDACAAPGAAANPKSLETRELASWLGVFKNEQRSVRVEAALQTLHQHLVANDETAKAAKLAEIVPHNMEDSFAAQAMRTFARKIDRHATNADAYQDFYTSIGTDQMTTDMQIEETIWLTRVQFVTKFLKLLREDLGRPLRILEIGTWDGITMLPMMKALEDSHFTAIEASAKALERLTDRVDKRGDTTRFRGVRGILGHDTMLKAKNGDGAARFDAVIFCEVIEHIVESEPALEEIRWALDEAHGRLFVSTPWGAFDRGYPEALEKRDPRGHVHAFTPRALHTLLTGAGFRILEMNGDGAPHGEGNFGDTQVVMAEIHTGPGYSIAINDKLVYTPPPSPQFVVPSALWPWNATLVEKTGMGASEETIVYLARELGRKGGSPAVYGPLPKTYTLDDQEVRDAVAYWPIAQAVEHLDPSRPVVVSRAPSYGPQLKAAITAARREPPSRMFLWLQDTWYPDLTPEVAAHYEKIIVLSQWHKETLVANTKIPLEKFKVIPNFVLREHFAGEAPKREPHRLIYCSSPDRGLLPLLRMWPEIRRRWPDATLGIYYGWEGAMKLAATNPLWAKQYRSLRAEFAKLKYQPGITEHGRVNHYMIAHEMRRASVWCYPIATPTEDRSSVETFCSNAVKARAAGCVPVTIARAALAETAKSAITQFVENRPLSVADMDLSRPLGHWDPWIDAIGLAFEATEIQRAAMAEQALLDYEIGAVLPKWQDVLG